MNHYVLSYRSEGQGDVQRPWALLSAFDLDFPADLHVQSPAQMGWIREEKEIVAAHLWLDL